MVTFPRGHSSKTLFVQHAARAKREAGGVNTSPGKVTWVQDPVDARGVPLIGRHTGGVIRGTQPERALIAKQPRQ
jgi:hypothetical protein